MHILIVSQYWYPENGVAQRRWTWLARVLADSGHEVTALAPPPHFRQHVSWREWWQNRWFAGDKDEEIGPSGERIIRSGFVPGGASLTGRIFNQATVAVGAIWALARYRVECGDQRPDLVIGTVPALPTAFVAALGGVIFRRPFIIDLRDAWPELLEVSERWNEATGAKSAREILLKNGPLQLLKSNTKHGLNFVLNRSSGLIVTTESLRTHLLRKQSNRSGSQVAVVRNVFSPRTQRPIPGRSPSQVGELNVLYAGTLGRAQDLQNALRAVSIAKASGVTVHLRLVGAGAAQKELRRIADSESIPVEIREGVSAESLEEYYYWADTALVHLADWAPLEMAIPSKTYELISSGIHISAVVNGEAASLVQSLNAGNVVPPGKPHELAEMWVQLSTNTVSFTGSAEGEKWVEEERRVRAPRALLNLIDEVTR